MVFIYAYDAFYELIERLSQKNYEKIKFVSNKRKILCTSLGMDSSLYSLKGIISLCEIGDIVDAFTLVRKIRDNLYFDLFFISESLNNKPDNYVSSKPFNGMNEEEILAEIMNYIVAVIDNEDNNTEIQNITRWYDNEFSIKDVHHQKSRSFSFESYRRNIEKKNPIIKECHDKFLKTIFKDLDNDLNNYVHSNGLAFISNDILDMNNDKFIGSIKELLGLLNTVKRLFLIDLFLIDSTLFETDDYIDALEMGLNPPEELKYNAIYQIVEEFENIDMENHELYIFLKDNNRFQMKCFYNYCNDIND